MCIHLPLCLERQLLVEEQILALYYEALRRKGFKVF